MTNSIAPERRRYRAFFIISLPVLFVGCLGAAAWVLVTTQSVFVATPLIIMSFGPVRMMRWAMIWVSTPEERRLFAPGMDREPLVGLARDFIKRPWIQPPDNQGDP